MANLDLVIFLFVLFHCNVIIPPPPLWSWHKLNVIYHAHNNYNRIRRYKILQSEYMLINLSLFRCFGCEFFNEKCFCIIAARFINVFICHCFYLNNLFPSSVTLYQYVKPFFWNTSCSIVVLWEIWVVDETCIFFKVPSIYRNSIFIVHKNLRFGIIYLILEYIQYKNLIPKNSCNYSSKVFL